MRTGRRETTRILLSWALVTGAGCASARASVALEATNRMQDQWTGAWVVTSTETFSDCAGFYTDNEVSGDDSVASRGRTRIDAGTPARVDSVDVRPERLSLRLTLSVNQMFERPHREFTLRALARCQAEVRVMVPPGIVEGGDVTGLESLLDRVVERHSDERSALLASNFLPVDTPEYAAERQEAIAEHREWRQEQTAEALKARLEQWTAQTTRLSKGISQDPDYLAGFGKGVEAGRNSVPSACEEVTRFEPALQPARMNAGAAFAAKGDRQKNWTRGYEDGMRLAQGLEVLRLMPGCMPPAPAPRPVKADPAASAVRR
ncbi:MAG TPA: hypothetical protein VFD06_05965 [Candidatus Polarisedimenticolia bacterium]|nr:hypothetical protein [Candidatus Polarisedimenticolia bacterium]